MTSTLSRNNKIFTVCIWKTIEVGKVDMFLNKLSIEVSSVKMWARACWAWRFKLNQTQNKTTLMPFKPIWHLTFSAQKWLKIGNHYPLSLRIPRGSGEIFSGIPEIKVVLPSRLIICCSEEMERSCKKSISSTKRSSGLNSKPRPHLKERNYRLSKRRRSFSCPCFCRFSLFAALTVKEYTQVSQ